MGTLARVCAAGVALASIVIVGVGAAGAAGTTTTTTTTTAAPAAPAAPAGRAATAAGTAVAVEIRSGTCPSTIYCFAPSSVTVSVGDTVRWVDTSHSPHTVTRCDPAVCPGTGGGTGTDTSFTRGDIGADQDFTYTFSGAGTYVYFCEIHGYSDMHGTITVRAAVTTTTTLTGPATTSPSSGPSGPTSGTGRSGTTSAGPHLASTGGSPRLLVVGWVLVATGALLTATRRARK